MSTPMPRFFIPSTVKNKVSEELINNGFHPIWHGNYLIVSCSLENEITDILSDLANDQYLIVSPDMEPEICLTEKSKSDFIDKLNQIINRCNKHIDRRVAIDPDISSLELDEDPYVIARNNAYNLLDFIKIYSMTVIDHSDF